MGRRKIEKEFAEVEADILKEILMCIAERFSVEGYDLDYELMIDPMKCTRAFSCPLETKYGSYGKYGPYISIICNDVREFVCKEFDKIIKIRSKDMDWMDDWSDTFSERGKGSI